MNAPRILVIRRDNIGDLVCTTPLLHTLRQNFPQAWLGVFANSYNAPVLEGNPDIDAVFAYRKRKHGGIGALELIHERLRLLLHLRSMQLDWVLIATPGWQPRSVRLARWMRPRRLAAFVEGASPLKGITDPVALAPLGGLSEAERVQCLAGVFGLSVDAPPPPRIIASPAALARIDAQLAAASNHHAENTLISDALVAQRHYSHGQNADTGTPTDGDPSSVAEDSRPGARIGFHISARKPSQRWAIEHFAQTIRTLHERFKIVPIVLWAPGGADNPTHPGDDERAAQLRRLLDGLPAHFIPTDTLSDLIAAITRCDRLILGDGGAMHIAAGLGKPVVCLFGQSDALRWHPWGVPYRLLQTQSHHVADISVDAVLSAYNELSIQPA